MNKGLQEVKAVPNACEKATEYREARDRIAKKMTAEQIAEAQRLAREWKPTPETEKATAAHQQKPTMEKR